MVRGRIICLILVFLFIFSNMGFTYAEEVMEFSDVPKDHWAYRHIHELRRLKITDGMGDNQYGIGRTLKRSEFVAFLVKLMKWDMITPDEGSFIDNMDSSKWYYGPIETALRHGVIKNDTDTFRPEEPITREEMAIMIVNALGYDVLATQLNSLGSEFDDVTRNTGYITIAKDFGFVSGVGNNKFNPYASAKREEAASMMMRMYERLTGNIDELNAFYAIRSANQADMIKSLDSVAFGWSQLEYDKNSNGVILNTNRGRGNDYGIPDGFIGPFSMAKENGVSTQLMVFAQNSLIEINEGLALPFLEYILTNPDISRQVIAAIVEQINSTTAQGSTVSFDGVVIDFENMKGQILKEAFNEFLKNLKQELDKYGKKLHVAVHPARKPGQAYFDGYDYKTIGEVADRVILMAHDYYARQLTDAEMDMGYTTTPLTPFDEIYYALKSITDENSGIQDRSKIWLQLSFDSAQWKLREGKVLNRIPYSPGYEPIRQKLIQDDVTINYSKLSQNPYATFYDSSDGTDNVIWYEDARSIEAKIQLAKMFGVKGISLWRLGNIPDYQEEGKSIYLNIWSRILELCR